jgi:predicted esterase
MRDDDPHSEQAVYRDGPSSAQARLGLILVHGRGGSAADMLTLARELSVSGVAVRAPQAFAHSWYPHSFLMPIEQNEPWLSSALRFLERQVKEFAQEGLPAQRVAMLGFSQGACLTLEYAARHPQRYAGIVALSGGVITPPAMFPPPTATLSGTPVFLGCSDRDPHIPLGRVRESAELFKRLGAVVDLRIYPQLGHTVNQEEVEVVAGMLETAAAG